MRLIPALRRKRKAGESWDQPGLHSDFQDSQSYIIRPYPHKNKGGGKKRKKRKEKKKDKDKVEPKVFFKKKLFEH